MTVRLPRRAHNPMLLDAGLIGTTTAIPWWGGPSRSRSSDSPLGEAVTGPRVNPSGGVKIQAIARDQLRAGLARAVRCLHGP